MSYFISREELNARREMSYAIIKDINKAEGTIRIFCGEGYHIFDYLDLQIALEERMEKQSKLTIKVIIGPTVCTEMLVRDGKLYKRNGLLELAKDGIIELYGRATRTNHPHYRIIDEGKICYVEEYHPVLTPICDRRIKTIEEKRKNF